MSVGRSTPDFLRLPSSIDAKVTPAYLLWPGIIGLESVTNPETLFPPRFQWTRPTAKWFVVTAVSQRWEICGSNDLSEGGWEVYEPLQDPDLFTRFSQIRLDDQAANRRDIRAFANRYGDVDWCGPELGAPHTPLTLWNRHVRRLQVAMTYYRLATTKSRAERGELKRLIAWSAPSDESEPCIRVRYAHMVDHKVRPSGTDTLAYGEGVSRLRESRRLEWRDDRRAALLYVEKLLRGALEDGFSSGGHWRPRPAQARFVLSEAPESRFRLEFMPTRLLGAIWLQFGVSITQGETLKTCATCGHLYRPRKSHQKRCSARCRKRAQRSRRATDGAN